MYQKKICFVDFILLKSAILSLQPTSKKKEPINCFLFMNEFFFSMLETFF